MEAAVLRLSDGMSEVIATNTIKTVDKLEKEKQKNEVRKEELKTSILEHSEARRKKAEERRFEREEKRRALEEMYSHMKKQLMYHKLFGTGMLLNNYMENGHSEYQDLINKIKEEQ